MIVDEHKREGEVVPEPQEPEDEDGGLQKRLLSAERIVHESDSVPYRLFGSECLRVERLYLLNGAPYIYYTHYLPAMLVEVDLSALQEQSLYRFIKENDIELANFRDEFSVSSAPPRFEELLTLDKEAQVLRMLRFSYDDMGNLVEYSEGYYNTAMQLYVVHFDE
ncbi:UTRA domain-containing protein [Cohnella sp. AR92]|nr:UTRA domain-containing protein [Cohnella sp. AR92]